MSESLILNVSDFVALCNQTLEFAYPTVIIEGEISDFRVSRGKWVYFDIKDEFSSLRCFGTVYMLPGPLEDGMKVRIYGAPRLHPKYNFSITLNRIEPAGEGALKRAFELLKAKLSAEGIFDESRKRYVQQIPESIAIVTSIESAAYGDFIKIITARWPLIKVYVCNVQVQGAAAVNDIVEGINYVNQTVPHCDAVVITRGGGSADDLAVFNDERVVRAIAGSRAPTVVAIGHERDVSLAELAADIHASTPSNAAELLVPDIAEQWVFLQQAKHTLHMSLSGIAAAEKQRLGAMRDQLDQTAHALIVMKKQELSSLAQLLSAYDPEAALERGYALLKTRTGAIIRTVAHVSVGDTITATLHDGSVEAIVSGTKSRRRRQ